MMSKTFLNTKTKKFCHFQENNAAFLQSKVYSKFYIADDLKYTHVRACLFFFKTLSGSTSERHLFLVANRFKINVNSVAFEATTT